jgi:copper chaperone CopZ
MSDDVDLETLDLTVTGMHGDACVHRLHDVVGALPGVEAVEARYGSLHVAYYPQAVSRAGIVEAVSGLGYGVVEPAARPEGFLARMTRTNQELFGNRRLDCCTLNRPAGRPAPEPES